MKGSVITATRKIKCNQVFLQNFISTLVESNYYSTFVELILKT